MADLPCGVHLGESLTALFRYLIIFPRGTLGRLLPAVGEQPLVLLADQERIDCALDHYHPGFLEFGEDGCGVGVLLAEYAQYAVLEDATAHLGSYVLCIGVYIHDCSSLVSRIVESAHILGSDRETVHPAFLRTGAGGRYGYPEDDVDPAPERAE